MQSSSPTAKIPAFALYGEDRAFPDMVHCEMIFSRAHKHDWRIRPHRHFDLHQVFVVESGSVTLELDGEKHQIDRPFALSIPSHVVHGFRFECNTQGYVLSVPMNEMAALTAYDPDLEVLTDAPIWIEATEKIASTVAEISLEQHSGSVARRPLLLALTTQVLCLIARENAFGEERRSPTRSMVFAFRRAVHRQIGHQQTVSQHAAALGLSATHLNRMCQDILGQSPREYMLSVAAQEAKRLLAYTLLDVAEIGYRLGFDDPSYFSRMFRRQTGLTPTEFRKPYLVSSY